MEVVINGWIHDTIYLEAGPKELGSNGCQAWEKESRITCRFLASGDGSLDEFRRSILGMVKMSCQLGS